MAWTLPFAEHRSFPPLFLFPPTHRVTRVVMLFQPLAGRITPLSLALLLTQLFPGGHGSLPLVLTTWPFSNATAAGRWTRWLRLHFHSGVAGLSLLARATWRRSRHRSQISSWFRIHVTCGLTDKAEDCCSGNDLRHTTILSPTLKPFHLSLCLHCWDQKNRPLNYFKKCPFSGDCCHRSQEQGVIKQWYGVFGTK